ncbi:MAG: peptidylprolyl isomerase [Persephonella sp.]|nr:peptidylprolyl isomerase [Persephonella sp.]
MDEANPFITTFAFVGTAFVALIVYKLSGNIQGVAQVNGKEIPMAEFYYQVELITRQMEAEGIDTAPLKKQIQAEAIRNVIQQELLYQEAEREGVTATREEVKEYLLDIDAFKENGHFSRDKYLAFLSQINLTPAFFEELLRKELSVRHLLTIHRAGFYLTEDEIDTYVNKQLARITGEYLLIKPPLYTPTEKEIQEYYQKHKEEFSGKKGKVIRVYQIDIKKLGQEKAEKEAQKLYRNLKKNIPVSETEGVKKIFEGTVYEKNDSLEKKLLKEIKKLTEDKGYLLYLKTDTTT